MSAEGTPSADHSLLARPLACLTGFCLRWPGMTVVLAVLLAVVCGVGAWQRLAFHSSRTDLLDPNDGYNKLWLNYVREFGDGDDAVVVVEGAAANRVAPVLDELAARLGREQRLFSAVLHGVDLQRIRGKGLHYLSLDELGQVDHFLNQAQPLLGGQWSQLNLGHQAARAGQLAAHPEALQDPQVRLAAAEMQSQLPQLVGGLHAALAENSDYASPWPAMPASLSTLKNSTDREYLLANEGRLGFVLLRISGGEGEFARGSEAIDELRRILAEVRGRHPEVTVGLTGLPVMENDEMRVSQSDMNLSNVVSLVAVALLFYAGFGGLRHSLLGVVALLLGMAWSFGYATLAVGHLNILSVAFGVVLIGLGIDFPIHYLACYLERRPHVENTRAALLAAARAVGPGVITGGMTTALAFFTTALTQFRGIAELGLISGGGIVLCIAAALFVLPALVLLCDRNRPVRHMPKPLPVTGIFASTQRYPRATVGLVTALALGAAAGLTHLRYDHNLLNLQPHGLESVELEHQLLAESDKSCWYALSMASSPEELLARKKKFLALPSVERVEEIASLFPADDAGKRECISRVRARLENLPERPPLIPVDPPEQLAEALARLQPVLLSGDNETRALRRTLEEARESLRTMSGEECFRRVSEYQQALAGDLLNRLHLLRSMSNPEPPALADLPESLVTRFVGKNQRQLLKIYARGSIWDMEHLERFVADVQTVDPATTGNPLQAYYASRQMQRSYVHAGIYAILMVMIIVMLDFRSVRCLLLSLFPLTLGVAETFGLLGWLGIPLNPANLIALPLIIGIGIDSGVHLVHDYLQQPGRYRLSNSTLNSIMLSALTTSGSFGALLFSSHQGLRTLGQVLVIGVSCCFLTAVTLLPAIFHWLDPTRRPASPEEPATVSDGQASRRRLVRPRRAPALVKNSGVLAVSEASDGLAQVAGGGESQAGPRDVRLLNGTREC